MKKWNSRKLWIWCIVSVAMVTISTTFLLLGKIDQYIFRDLMISVEAFTLSYFVANVWNKKVQNGFQQPDNQERDS